MNIGEEGVEENRIGSRAMLWEVNVSDDNRKKADPQIHLPGIEKLEETHSDFYELRKGKIWFSE